MQNKEDIMAPSPTERLDDRELELNENLSDSENDMDINVLQIDNVCRKRTFEKLSSETDSSASEHEDAQNSDHDSNIEECSVNECKRLPIEGNSEVLCSQCIKLNQENPQNMTVYYKKKEDAIVKNSSIRAALFESFPLWFKSFLRDPEYVMSSIKSKYSSE